MRACLWSTEPVPLIARTALLSVAVFVWSACPASLRTHINPLSAIALTEHNPTLRVSLVGLNIPDGVGAETLTSLPHPSSDQR